MGVVVWVFVIWIFYVDFLGCDDYYENVEDYYYCYRNDKGVKNYFWFGDVVCEGWIIVLIVLEYKSVD